MAFQGVDGYDGLSAIVMRGAPRKGIQRALAFRLLVPGDGDGQAESGHAWPLANSCVSGTTSTTDCP